MPEPDVEIKSKGAAMATALEGSPDPASLQTENAPVTGALGGGPPQPDKFNLQSPTTPVTPPPLRHPVTDKIANFISGGQATPGSVWRGILSGALTGMAAGAAQGHLGTGMAAGGAAAERQRQQQFQNRITLTREESENKFRAAQTAKALHDLTASTWDLSARQDKARQEHIDMHNNMLKEAQLIPESKDLGIVRDLDDLAALHQAHPELPKDMARNSIFGVSHFSPDLDAKGNPTGTEHFDGLHAFYIPPAYANQMIDHTWEVPIFVPPSPAEAKAGKPGHYGIQTLEAGKHTNAEAFGLLTQRSAEAAKYENEAAVARAQAAAAAAAAKVAKLQVDQAAAEQEKVSIEHQGRDIVEGDFDPSQVNKRGKTFNAVKEAANAYSMTNYGKPFDWAKAENDYKSAYKVRPTLDFMNGLTGVDGRSGNLGQLQRMSNTITRTDFPSVNNAEAWLKIEKGDPSIGSFRILALETADSVGKILQGGGTGSGTTDAKLKQAQDMFNTGWSKQSLAGIITTLREALNGRKMGLIQNNRYLMKWYGPNSALMRSLQPATPGGPIPGATPDNPLGLTP